MKTQTFKLTESEIEKMEKASKQLDRSKSYIVRAALDYYLDELIENEIALERLKNPADKIISSEEMDELISE